MSTRFIFITLLLTNYFNGFSQKTDNINVYLDKLGRLGRFSNVGDSLIFKEIMFSKDTLADIEIILLDTYGSYKLQATSKLTHHLTFLLYKGEKTKFKIAKASTFDEGTNKPKNYNLKVYCPTLVTGCW